MAVAFVADDLAAWLVALLADAGRRKLTVLILGSEQKRELARAASEAVQAAARELRPGDQEGAAQLAMVVGEVFSRRPPEKMLDGHTTVLDALESGIAKQLAVLDDPEVTGAGVSSAEVLGVRPALLAETLAIHLVRQIVAHGAEGGALFPLASQLGHDLTHLQNRRLASMIRQLGADIIDALDHLGSSGIPRPQVLAGRRERPEPAYWATVREIRRRTGALIGRQEELAYLTSLVPTGQRYQWLVGAAWAGKTSLLAEVVIRLQAECDVVCYFLSRREADADSSRFLAAVVPQMEYLLDEEPRAADLHVFRALWERAAERAEIQGRHLFLVVDGLDEDVRPQGLPSVAALLPHTAGGHVHVLVASRPHPELPVDVPVGHPLAHTQRLRLGSFSGAKRLADLARQEIDDLIRRDDDGLAADLVGLLAAAAGPMTVQDLAAMTVMSPPSPGRANKIRALITSSMARSLQVSHLTRQVRYQFAHESLLAYAQGHDDLDRPEYRRRLHEWAERWRAVNWPTIADGGECTPEYLLDAYPSTLNSSSQRLVQLTSDVGWIEAAIDSAGVETTLANLRRAAAANPGNREIEAVLMAVNGQAHYLQPEHLIGQPGYTLRQLCMQANELVEERLAEALRVRLRSRSGFCIEPKWTTRRASRAFLTDFGYAGELRAMALLKDGRVVSVGRWGKVRIWDAAVPGAAVEINYRSTGDLEAVAVMSDGRVIIGGRVGLLLIMDMADPRAIPIELGRHDGVKSIVATPDNKVITWGSDTRVLIWDPKFPGTAPIELEAGGGHFAAMAVLPDGRVVTSDYRGRILIWDIIDFAVEPIELGQIHTRSCKWIVAMPDGRLVTESRGGQMLVWNPAGAPGADPVELGQCHSAVRATALLPDGRLVTGLFDGRILIWDLAAPDVDPIELGRHDEGVLAMTLLRDGRLLTGAGRYNVRLLIWDPEAAGEAKIGRHDDEGLLAVALLPGGRIVTGATNGRVLIWDPAASDSEAVELGRHSAEVLAIAVLADGRVVTAGGRYDEKLLIWDPSTPSAAPIELGSHDAGAHDVKVLPDNRVVSGGADGRLLIWDPTDPGIPTQLGHIDFLIYAKMAVLADGRVAASDGGYFGQISIWDPAEPGSPPIKLIERGTMVSAMAVLADGRLMTCWIDGRVLIWDLAAIEDKPKRLDQKYDVTAWSVLSDGSVITCGLDGRVLVWDPSNPCTEVVRLSNDVAAMAAVSFSAVRSNIVVAHRPAGLSLWSYSAESPGHESATHRPTWPK